MLAIVISANLISCAQTPAKDANNGYKAEQEGWLVNLDEAYALSKKTNKPIMANFTGSDWCGWCKRLSAAVFVKDDFKAWAKKNVILLELDFPRGKAIPDAIRTQNANLQQAFQVSGYPTIWVFDLEKDKKTNQYQINALGKTGYTATVQEFTSGVDQMIAKRAAK
ncbi:MAG: thioredoxin family protein [Saprospiraceae bacterium]|nr:thioredoxin family protein [Candidatus Vicinibacter affinis]MBK7881854.1 thioredoxin family protein [Candidatus Vicinibacter proximus]MBK6573947.1 thioredoxin family protein [Candidatus Vicinibacter affinis]MBK6821607.1 thioredoxin family protein [Candidatus Vicinibacter affinis]MBK7302888.1 thioredoxin family protein [Candidatus Vicinibacter affinis]